VEHLGKLEIEEGGKGEEVVCGIGSSMKEDS